MKRVSVLLIISIIINGCIKSQTPVNPKQSYVWTNKGVALAKLEKYEAALECFNKATKLNPENPLAWRWKGTTIFNMSKDKGIIERTGKLNNTKYDISRFEEALKAFEKAIEIEPDYADAWFGKGAILGGLGRYEEALNAINEAIKLNPKDSGAWWNKGVALQKLGRYGEAEKAFKKAIKINPAFKKGI